MELAAATDVPDSRRALKMILDSLKMIDFALETR
jgi:hypothetical protein